MAHYAFLDENYVVTEVITGKDEDEGLYDWEKFYASERGQMCKRTSYNTWGGQHKEGGTPFRKNYAIIGGIYDPDRDAFIPPRDFPSWVLNEDTCLWEAPTPYPNDGQFYYWNEQDQIWSPRLN
jgi:hypothetical protein